MDVVSPWLFWVLLPGFIIGVGTVAAVILSLFASFGRRPPQFAMRHPPALLSALFYRTLSAHCGVPVEHGSVPTVLHNGDAIFPALLSAIRSARHSVHIMVFIWNDGAASDMLLSALRERARAGVEVRLLIDSLGGIRAPDAKFVDLEAAGATVAWFRRIAFGALTLAHRRNHRRAIVIDGAIAFTGGASIADEWLGNAASPRSWRDFMVQVDGLMAQRLQDAFVGSWHAVTGEVLADVHYFPPCAPRSATQFMSLVSSPSDASQPLRTLLWLSLACATERIRIVSAYFVPDEIIRAVLRERARAGVDVCVLTPNRHTDMPPVQWAGRRAYAELLADGVRIAEYQPTMLHSKCVVVDGQWSIVGSANIDVRSKELNEENVLAIASEQLGAELERAFADDWGHAHEMTPAAWRRRGWWWRCKERVAAWFAEQF